MNPNCTCLCVGVPILQQGLLHVIFKALKNSLEDYFVKTVNVVVQDVFIIPQREVFFKLFCYFARSILML